VSVEIHDTSRIDAFMASRRRAMFLHALWRPMLAGAAGAALIVGAVWVASPRLHYNEIEVPRVTFKDVIIPNVITKDVTVDHVVPRDVEVDHVVPHDVSVDHYVGRDSPGDLTGPRPGLGAPTSGPQASAPPATGPQGSGASTSAAAPPKAGPDSPYAARTPDEKKFVDQPAYQSAEYRGRIVKSRDGLALSFEDGKDYWPGHWNETTHVSERIKDKAFETDEFVGDLGMCAPVKDRAPLVTCTAFHNGQQVGMVYKEAPAHATPQPASPSTACVSANGLPILEPRCEPKPAPAKFEPGGTQPADQMVKVYVDVAGYPLSAMVDTGCSWPMSMSKMYADTLVSDGRATRTTPAKSTLADGSVHDAEVVVLNQITVDGHVLKDVVAAVSESNTAPTLLGLGALNRLGDYHIVDGRIEFTGEQQS
jgi:gag-polyprotein putative aspartyl protease